MKKRLSKSYYIPAILLLIMSFITGIDYFFKCVNGTNLNILDSNGIINIFYFFFQWTFVIPGFVAAAIVLITKRKGFFLILPFIYLTFVSFVLIVFDLIAGIICVSTNASAAINVILTAIFSEYIGNILLFFAFACTALNIFSNWRNKTSRIWFVPGALAVAWGISWSLSIFMTNTYGTYTGDLTLFELLENVFNSVGVDRVINVTPSLPKVSIGLLVFALFITNKKLSKDIDKEFKNSK